MFFVINNKVYIYNIKIYNNKVYTNLSLYVTVLTVECPSMITLIPPPPHKNTAPILTNSKYCIQR
jgi:hypothetical protein